MNKILILSLFLFFGAFFSNAQTIEREVIGSTGGISAEDSGRVLLFNVGEIAIKTSISGTFLLTQGFEQPDSFSKKTNSNNIKYTIGVYPNPGGDKVFIGLLSSVNTTLYVIIYNDIGQEYHRLHITLLSNQVHTEELITTNMASGPYLFHFIENDGSTRNVVKWIHY